MTTDPPVPERVITLTTAEKLKKALGGLSSTLLGAAATAFAAYFMDPAHVAALVSALPAKYAFLSVLSGAIVSFATDYYRHHTTP